MGTVGGVRPYHVVMTGSMIMLLSWVGPGVIVVLGVCCLIVGIARRRGVSRAMWVAIGIVVASSAYPVRVTIRAQEVGWARALPTTALVAFTPVKPPAAEWLGHWEEIARRVRADEAWDWQVNILVDRLRESDAEGVALPWTRAEWPRGEMMVARHDAVDLVRSHPLLTLMECSWTYRIDRGSGGALPWVAAGMPQSVPDDLDRGRIDVALMCGGRRIWTTSVDAFDVVDDASSIVRSAGDVRVDSVDIEAIGVSEDGRTWTLSAVHEAAALGAPDACRGMVLVGGRVEALVDGVVVGKGVFYTVRLTWGDWPQAWWRGMECGEVTFETSPPESCVVRVTSDAAVALRVFTRDAQPTCMWEGVFEREVTAPRPGRGGSVFLR